MFNQNRTYILIYWQGRGLNNVEHQIFASRLQAIPRQHEEPLTATLRTSPVPQLQADISHVFHSIPTSTQNDALIEFIDTRCNFRGSTKLAIEIGGGDASSHDQLVVQGWEGRSIARSLGRSIARSLGRSVARSLDRSIPFLQVRTAT